MSRPNVLPRRHLALEHLLATADFAQEQPQVARHGSLVGVPVERGSAAQHQDPFCGRS